MENNVAKLSCQIIFRNIIFHFLNAKNGFYCEATTKNMVQIVTLTIITQSSPYVMDNPQVLGIFLISI